MPGRIQWEDLHRTTRAKVTKIADRLARPAPAPSRSAREPAARWFCLTCGMRTKYLTVIERHCGDTGHYRYSDLGLGL